MKDGWWDGGRSYSWPTEIVSFLIASAKFPGLEGSISLPSLYGSDVNQGNLERRSVQNMPLAVQELPLRPTASKVV